MIDKMRFPRSLAHFKMEVEKMALSGIDETRKVSFDDYFLSDSVCDHDESSIEGLVTVPEEYDGQSTPLPFFPDTNGAPTMTLAPNLYSEFDPPRNPETMRKYPKYATITATPDYCKIYRSYNWRRVSVDPSSSRMGRGDKSHQSSSSTSSSSSRSTSFRSLLSRYASTMRRSEASRSNILQHHSTLSQSIDLGKGVDETLRNETRSRVLKMVREELGDASEEERTYWVENEGEKNMDESDDEESHELS